MYAYLRRILFSIPAESAHQLGFLALRVAAKLGILRLFGESLRPQDPKLRVSALGLQFPSPIGLAAGFDKNAEEAANFYARTFPNSRVTANDGTTIDLQVAS